ncbi:MAG TPA: SirB2 family protein [Steroidobacteraceae bacterium]|nr:SirB2 family protein [Steroidobacteraceae bacterium]
MIEYYVAIRNVHVYSVLTSLSLFAFRGGLMLVDSALLRTAFLRYAPHVVDTVLLTSALMLTTIIHQYPFVNAWLTVKVLALVAYIVLGSIAIKRGRTKRTRIVAFAAALLVFGFIYTVARAHDPLGVFARGAS